MTTGRINQVTILNRRRGAGHPPRGRAALSVTMQVSERECAARRRDPARQEQEGPTTDSIAPTEFPRASATAETFGLMPPDLAA